VENLKSPLNVALAAELRAERVAINMTIEELRQRAGLTKPTMLRILAGTRDINVTQLAKLGTALDVTPEDLLRRAVTRMGGMDVLTAQAEGPGTSEAGSNVLNIEDKRYRNMTAADIDEYQREPGQGKAALHDDEMNQPESFD
jgi:transcriptional regulator with XRE-family HTH domain